jgi:predicted dehydrogenase
VPGRDAHPERWDEKGKPYDCTADDSAYATFELAGGVIAHFNSSWCVRVRRDDLLTLQVDGTQGQRRGGLRNCWIQPYGATPRRCGIPTSTARSTSSTAGRRCRPANYDNAFKVQWELFLRHVVKDEPFPWTLLEGAKGVQLAELGGCIINIGPSRPRWRPSTAASTASPRPA